MSASVLLPGFTAAVLLAAAMCVHGAFGWLVAAPFAWAALERRSWRSAVGIGVAFGAAAGVAIHASWLAATAQAYFGLSPAAAWLGALVLALATGVSQGALLGLGLGAAARLGGATSLLAAGAVWAAWEQIGLEVFPQYPWASLLLGSARPSSAPGAAIQDGAILAGVSIVGSLGVTWLLATAGSAIGRAFARHADGSRAVTVLVACVLALAALGAGASRKAASTDGALCTIESIDAAQPGPEGSAAAYAEATRRGAQSWNEPPSIVVWPESSLEASPETDPGLLARLRQLRSETGGALITGGTRLGWTSDWQPRRFNSAFVLGGDGGLRFYDKRRVVPLAEVWPWGWLPAPAALRTDWIDAGRGSGVIEVSGCKVGLLICFEAESMPAAMELADGGADILVVLTNDAVLPARPVEWEVAEARLRAAETGLPVLRAANAGQSFIAGPRGQMSAGRFAVQRPALAPAVAVAPRLRWLCFAVAAIAVAAGVSARSWPRSSDSP